MIYTLANEQKHEAMAQFLIGKGLTIQQGYDFMRSKGPSIKGFKYRYSRVLGYMQRLQNQQ